MKNYPLFLWIMWDRCVHCVHVCVANTCVWCIIVTVALCNVSHVSLNYMYKLVWKVVSVNKTMSFILPQIIVTKRCKWKVQYFVYLFSSV